MDENASTEFPVCVRAEDGAVDSQDSQPHADRCQDLTAQPVVAEDEELQQSAVVEGITDGVTGMFTWTHSDSRSLCLTAAGAYAAIAGMRYLSHGMSQTVAVLSAIVAIFAYAGVLIWPREKAHPLSHKPDPLVMLPLALATIGFGVLSGVSACAGLWLWRGGHYLGSLVCAVAFLASARKADSVPALYQARLPLLEETSKALPPSRAEAAKLPFSVIKRGVDKPAGKAKLDFLLDTVGVTGGAAGIIQGEVRSGAWSVGTFEEWLLEARAAAVRKALSECARSAGCSIEHGSQLVIYVEQLAAEAGSFGRAELACRPSILPRLLRHRDWYGDVGHHPALRKLWSDWGKCEDGGPSWAAVLRKAWKSINDGKWLIELAAEGDQLVLRKRKTHETVATLFSPGQPETPLLPVDWQILVAGEGLICAGLPKLKYSMHYTGFTQDWSAILAAIDARSKQVREPVLPARTMGA